jgi:hypothetical protein
MPAHFRISWAAGQPRRTMALLITAVLGPGQRHFNPRRRRRLSLRSPAPPLQKLRSAWWARTSSQSGTMPSRLLRSTPACPPISTFAAAVCYVRFTSIPAVHCVSSRSASSAIRSLSAPMIRRRCGPTDVAPAAGMQNRALLARAQVGQCRSLGIGDWSPHSRVVGLLLSPLRPSRGNCLRAATGFRFQWRRNRLACRNVLVWRFSGRPNWRSG